ncbi:MAG: hypothetical protein ACREJP_04215, partial [Candidatus Methylomirabilales bacterium]
LEEDDALQDAVLSIYHAEDLTFSSTPVVKIVENHLGSRHVRALPEVIVQAAPAPAKPPARGTLPGGVRPLPGGKPAARQAKKKKRRR